MNPRVVALHTYPIKGCAGIALTDALLTPAGIAHDRTFLIVDEHGVFRSQRRDPKLATIRPEVVDDGRELMLHAPGTDALRIAVVLDGPRRPVEMFGVPYRGIDQGDAVAEWLSHVLGSRSSLVRVPPEHDRVTDGETPGTAAYADSGALLLTSRASLAELNRRIALRGATAGGWKPAELAEPAGRVSTVPIDRFRPNVVVDGWAEPHVEDLVREASIGDTELGFAKLAIRCAVTLVDQRTGVRVGPEPLRTLADYRRIAEKGVAFGAKFSVLHPGRLAVGDELVVRRSFSAPVTE
jgi:uncharacterized protein YcbX